MFDKSIHFCSFQQPNDIAYVHSGYAPLSVRLAQFLERQSGWRGLEEVLRQLPGATVEERQHIPPALLKKNNTGGGGGQAPTADGGPQRVTLVYFLGGCTYSEISALRFLAQQENGKFVFVLLIKLLYSRHFSQRFFLRMFSHNSEVKESPLNDETDIFITILIRLVLEAASYAVQKGLIKHFDKSYIDGD